MLRGVAWEGCCGVVGFYVVILAKQLHLDQNCVLVVCFLSAGEVLAEGLRASVWIFFSPSLFGRPCVDADGWCGAERRRCGGRH